MKQNLMAGPPEMMAVYENKQANSLIDLYTKEFEKAFGIKPIFEQNGYHTGTFTDIAKSAQGQAADLIKHFFRVKDDWFHKQGYSPECLKKNLPAIAMDLKKRVVPTHEGPLKVTTQYSCDTCFEYYTLTTTVDFLYSEKPRNCESCTAKTNSGPKG